jgi:hypothetical protein
MADFSKLPEFDKELKKLSKKYLSLVSDIEDIKPILLSCPTGIGKNFTIIHSAEDIKIVKVRIHCESLRTRTIRLIYAYQEKKIKFVYLEVYFKGNKANEDRKRVKQYLKMVG